MIPFDSFAGLIGMHSDGQKLSEPGNHLWVGYAKYAGYPARGFSLMRVPPEEYKIAVGASVPLAMHALLRNEYTITSSLVLNSPLVRLVRMPSGEGGMLLCQWQGLDLKFKAGVRALQFDVFTLGGDVLFEITLESGVTKRHSMKLPRFVLRPYYFEAKENIRRIRITGSAALLVEIQLLRKGWMELRLASVARLNLPGDQTEIDQRVANAGVAAGDMPIKVFNEIQNLKAKFEGANPAASPAYFKLGLKEAVAPGLAPSGAEYETSHHRLISTLSIDPIFARAAGLYAVDPAGSTEGTMYLLGGHWGSDKTADGYITYGPVIFHDTDEFRAPEGFRATRINGKMTEIASQRDKSGVVGVGLNWFLPERTIDTPQNHAVRYKLSREESGGNSTSEEILTGLTFQNGDWVPSPFQAVDFGDGPEEGLDGAFVYRLLGIDLFGRLSDPALTDEVTVDSFSIPPAPTGIAADPQLLSSSDQFNLTFAWTLNEHAKDPDVSTFVVYLDNRSLFPLAGQITSSAPAALLNGGPAENVEVNPMHAPIGASFGSALPEDALLVGGLLRVENEFFPIGSVESRSPLILRVAAASGDISAGQRCSISPNWKDPSIWKMKLGEVLVKSSPEDNLVKAIAVLAEYDQTQEVSFESVPFVGRSPTFQFPDFNARVALEPASVEQVHGGETYEFLLEPVPDSADPKQYLVSPLYKEDGTILWPKKGACKTYMRVRVKVDNFDINLLDNSDSLSKRFAVGVSAIDAPSDGSNAGPVSVRTLCEWIDDTIPDVLPALPAVVADEAEPVRANGMSQYDLEWDPIPNAAMYHVYRAPGVLIRDMERDRLIADNEDPASADNLTLDELLDAASETANGRAFSRITTEPWRPVINTAGRVVFRDRTLPGRSRDYFFYKVQALSGTGMAGQLSPPLNPVICPVARKPEKLAFQGYDLRKVAGQMNVRLYWRHIPIDGLDYYVVYRTANAQVAQTKVWRQFEHAIKVPGNANARPLTVEFGLVDLSAQPDGRSTTPLGVFRRAEFDAAANAGAVNFADVAAAGAQNFLDPGGATQLGRVPVQGLADGEPVVCFYENAGGAEQPPLVELASEKLIEDLIPDGSRFYYAVAAVDNLSHIADLSDAIEVNLAPPE